jgi:pimeloyl-ACP methyl ester carboxylesterase
MSANNSAREPKRDDVIVSGLRLHYLDWGGAGAPIVVVHATGFLGRIYAPIARELTKIGRVFSYDQRGHGDSTQPPLDQIGWDHTAADLEGFIAAMKLGPVRAFGHSAGGTAIGSVAGLRPELITRAVIAEPVLIDVMNLPEGPADLRERTIKRKRTFDSVDAMYRNFEHKPPYATWRREILRDYCEFGTRADANGARSLKCPPEIEAEFYASARDFDGLGLLLKSPTPMLVMFGEKTDSPGLMLKDRIAAGAPQRRVMVIPGATHFLPMEQPEYVARLAVEFLAGE